MGLAIRYPMFELKSIAHIPVPPFSKGGLGGINAATPNSPQKETPLKPAIPGKKERQKRKKKKSVDRKWKVTYA
jgi:hypothetical protein